MKNMYIHIPFCKNICSYCDFCKIFYNENIVNKYLKKLKEEIINNYKKDELETIYIGGGTPSSLNIYQLKELFNIIKDFNLIQQAFVDNGSFFSQLLNLYWGKKYILLWTNLQEKNLEDAVFWLPQPRLCWDIPQQ